MTSNTPDTKSNEGSEREQRESRFLVDFREGKFINEMTGLQNPFEIEQWWNKEIIFKDQAHKAEVEALVKYVDMEVYALEKTLEKSKELSVAIGHKRVYERLKLISEYKGKLEAWKEIKEYLHPTPLPESDKSE